MNEHKLGRIPEFDEKSKDYPVRKLLSREQLAPLTKGRAWGCSIWLDQPGSECTGMSASYDLATSPVRVSKADGSPLDEQFAIALYHLAQKYDEWEGEDYDGSSVLGAAKALVKLGYVGTYHWAFDITEIYASLAHIGPVVVGTDWLNSMFVTDEYGLMRVDPDSGVAGGHAYTFRSIIVNEAYKTKLVGTINNRLGTPLLRCRQSWGKDFGVNGEFLMWGTDLAKLLKGIDSPGEARITTSAFKPTF